MSAKLIGHVTHYGDNTWSARGEGWSIAGNGSRDALKLSLARHGYIAEQWRSVPGVCYDAPDGTPVYSDLAQVRNRAICGECGARVSLSLEMYAPCSECGEWL